MRQYIVKNKLVMGLVLLLVMYFIFGVLFSTRIRTYNAPDEHGHYYNITVIGDKGQIPKMTIGAITREGHQPPAYYLICQPVYQLTKHWDHRNQILALRFLTLFIASGAIIFTFFIAKKLFPDQFFLIISATALVALNPQYIFISGIISNDSLTNTMGAACLFLLVYLLFSRELSWKLIGAVGLVSILAFLSKTTLWPIVLVLFLVLMIKGGSKKLIITLAAFTPLYVVGVWWFCRNYIIYKDITGFKFMKFLWYKQQHRDFLNFSGVTHWLGTVFQSYWARLGYFDVSLPSIYYYVIGAGSVVAAIGLIYFILRAFRNFEKERKYSMLLLVAMALIIFAGIFIYNLSFYQPQGRYLFPVISVLSLALSVGLLQIIPRKFYWISFSLLTIFLVAMDVNSLLLIIKDNL